MNRKKNDPEGNHNIFQMIYLFKTGGTVAQLVDHYTGDRRFASLSLAASGATVFCP